MKHANGAEPLISAEYINPLLLIMSYLPDVVIGLQCGWHMAKRERSAAIFPEIPLRCFLASMCSFRDKEASPVVTGK